MGASKSRASKSRQERRDRYRRRPSTSTLQTKPVIAIVCDDTATACRYLDTVKRYASQTYSIQIVSAPTMGARPADVLSTALDKYRDLVAEDARSDEDKNHVYALLDTEADSKTEAECLAARSDPQFQNVTTLLSHPCFEVWILAHFIACGKAYGSCKDVLADVGTEWKKRFGSEMGSKSKADYAKLQSYWGQAIANAKSHCEPKKSMSWTEIYVVIEKILENLGT